jgi:hypothetical protein
MVCGDHFNIFVCIIYYYYQREEEGSGCKFVVQQPICAYWDMGNAAWDTTGCQYDGTAVDSKEVVTCVCNHLTSFGIIFDWQGAADPQDPGILYSKCTQKNDK